jgi:hypothetical protein
MAVKRILPTRNADSDAVATPSRASAYLEAYTVPMGGGNWGFADEGSYYVGNNATLATGIAGHAAPVVADTDTKALFHLFNGSTKNVVMDYLFTELTNAGTAGTITYTVAYLDAKGATALSSGGTAITPVSTLSGGGALPSGIVTTFGACVTAMTSSVKVGQQIAREVIPVVQDTLLVKFGAVSGAPHAGITSAGTATNHMVQLFAPIVIAPGGNLNIAHISPSQSAARSYQVSFGFWVR